MVKSKNNKTQQTQNHQKMKMIFYQDKVLLAKKSFSNIIVCFKKTKVNLIYFYLMFIENIRF